MPEKQGRFTPRAQARQADCSVPGLPGVRRQDSQSIDLRFDGVKMHPVNLRKQPFSLPSLLSM